METSVVMAAASDKQTLVQVPADLLESLITTVDSLQKELKEVKNDLAKTQQNHGVQFPQFSKLPLHVRRYANYPYSTIMNCIDHGLG